MWKRCARKFLIFWYKQNFCEVTSRNYIRMQKGGVIETARYRQSLTEPNDKYNHKYRSFYRSGKCKARPWRAVLNVSVCPNFPAIDPSNYSFFQKAITEGRKIAEEEDVPFKMAFKSICSKLSCIINQKIQWEGFLSTSPNHILGTFRGGWYHDPLLTEIKDPYMRLIRKARLGVSELASQTHYLSQSKSRICSHCQSNSIEDLHHYFFECSAYDSQRASFLDSVRPLLYSLGLPQGKVAPILGFPQGPASKRYFQTHSVTRKQLYLETCKYMRSTQRFRFV